MFRVIFVAVSYKQIK